MSIKKIEMSEESYYAYMNTLINTMINPSSDNIDNLILYGKNLNNIDVVKNIVYAELGLGKEYLEQLESGGYLPEGATKSPSKISIHDANNISKSGIIIPIPNKASVIRDIGVNTKNSKTLDNGKTQEFDSITRDVDVIIKSKLSESNGKVSHKEISNKVVSDIKSKTNIEKQFKNALRAAFNKYQGLSYEWGGKVANPSKGRTKSNGLDCSGLMMSIYKEGKIHIGYGTRDQSHDTHGKSIFVGNSKNNYRVDSKDLKPGDMVYINSGKGNVKNSSINHVMMYMGDGKFVHSGVKGGVTVLDNSTAKMWLGRVKKVVRIAYNEDIMKHFIDGVNKTNSKRKFRVDSDSVNVNQRNKNVKTWDFSKNSNRNGISIPKEKTI